MGGNDDKPQPVAAQVINIQNTQQAAPAVTTVAIVPNIVFFRLPPVLSCSSDMFIYFIITGYLISLPSISMNIRS